MAAEFSNQIDWDGQALYIEAATDAGRVTCRVPRDTVHVIRLYSDPEANSQTGFRPSCSRCGRSLLLARIGPEAPGFDPG